MLRPCPSSVVSIRGCHPWMIAMDGRVIHGWHPQMTSTDDISPSMNGILICQIFGENCIHHIFELEFLSNDLWALYFHTPYENCIVCCNSSQKLIVENSMANVWGTMIIKFRAIIILPTLLQFLASYSKMRLCLQLPLSIIQLLILRVCVTFQGHFH